MEFRALDIPGRSPRLLLQIPQTIIKMEYVAVACWSWLACLHCGMERTHTILLLLAFRISFLLSARCLLRLSLHLCHCVDNSLACTQILLQAATRGLRRGG